MKCLRNTATGTLIAAVSELHGLLVFVDLA